MNHFSVVVFSQSSLNSSYHISSYSIPHRGDTLSFQLPLAPCRPLDSCWQPGTSDLGAWVLPAISSCSSCPSLKGNTHGMEPTSSHFFSLGKGNCHWPSFLVQNSEFSLIPPFSLSPHPTVTKSHQAFFLQHPSSPGPLYPVCFCSRSSLLTSLRVHGNYCSSGPLACVWLPHPPSQSPFFVLQPEPAFKIRSSGGY